MTTSASPSEPSNPSTEPNAELHLYTPAEAAEVLAVKESWLRRKAGMRAVACTFLGRHLRFSTADLRAITTQGAHTPKKRPGRPSR